MTDAATTFTLIGGPTVLIAYGGMHILTDPTFDPPGEHPRPGTPVVLRKLAGPAMAPAELPPIDLVLLSHDHHADNLDPASRAFLPRAGRVLTTAAGAERLGDNASVDVAGRIAAEHGPFDVVLLFAGGGPARSRRRRARAPGGVGALQLAARRPQAGLRGGRPRRAAANDRAG